MNIVLVIAVLEILTTPNFLLVNIHQKQMIRTPERPRPVPQPQAPQRPPRNHARPEIQDDQEEEGVLQNQVQTPILPLHLPDQEDMEDLNQLNLINQMLEEFIPNPVVQNLFPMNLEEEQQLNLEEQHHHPNQS